MAALLDKGFRAVDSTLQVIAKKSADRPAATRAKAKKAKKRGAESLGQRLGQWGIQVGAFKTYATAYKVARKAVSLAPAVLDAGIVSIVPLKKGGKTSVFRARILGLVK